MTTESPVNRWLSGCLLCGGSSGGSWVKELHDDGCGTIVSVNTWGYTNSPGMAGPKLMGTSTERVFNAAKICNGSGAAPADGRAGQAVTCGS